MTTVVKIYKCIGKKLAVIANQYFTNPYQQITNYLSCFCNYFLIDFVIEVFIIKVTIRELFYLKPPERKVAIMQNP